VELGLLTGLASWDAPQQQIRGTLLLVLGVLVSQRDGVLLTAEPAVDMLFPRRTDRQRGGVLGAFNFYRAALRTLKKKKPHPGCRIATELARGSPPQFRATTYPKLVFRIFFFLSILFTIC
jgi:hypothetical protein